MGTSGAFGGSATTTWNAVGSFLGDPPAGVGDGQSGTDGTADGDAPPADGDTPTAAENLAALVAQALQADDPGLRPRYAPAARVGDSGLNVGRLTGRPRRTGTTREAPTSGRRSIAWSVGRAGRALGAAHALAAGDAAALAEYGLDLSRLAGLDKVDQILEILDAVAVENAGPDDVALRGVIYDALDRVLEVADPAAPIETLREIVCDYAVQLFAVELDAAVQRGVVDVSDRDTYLAELSEVIRADAASMDLSGATVTTPQQFEHAAQQLMRATLSIVVEGGSE